MSFVEALKHAEETKIKLVAFVAETKGRSFRALVGVGLISPVTTAVA